jgi:hypothetical protein
MTTTKHLRLVLVALAALTFGAPLAHGKGGPRNSSPVRVTNSSGGTAHGFTAPPQRKPSVVSRFDCAGRHNCKPGVHIIRDHREQPGKYYVHR